jgi:regulator of protease activity HflC (stomatin/prohibitin superfamily)
MTGKLTSTNFLLFNLIRVKEKQAIIVERFGKFSRELKPGLRVLWPIIDSVAYMHSLKEEVYQISSQSAITKDNVEITIDGVLYLKIFDAQKASYGIGNPIEAMQNLAQTTMRSELGKLKLDDTFKGREELNHGILSAINEAASNWGINCMRYEIKDITIPNTLRKAMERQAESERQKRAEILNTEGKRQAEINVAEGLRQAAILTAEGQAKAIAIRADATGQSIRILAESMHGESGAQAVKLRVAEKYLEAYSNLAKPNNTMIIPSAPNDIGKMVHKAFNILEKVNQDTKNT